MKCRWRIDTVPFAFNVSFFVLVFEFFATTINRKGIDNEFYAGQNRSSKPADSALGHGWKWIRLEQAIFFFCFHFLCLRLSFFFLFFLRGIKYWPLAGASRKLVTDFACFENQSLSMLPVDSGGYINVISLSLHFIDSKIIFFHSRVKSKSMYLKRIPQNCRGIMMK